MNFNDESGLTHFQNDTIRGKMSLIDLERYLDMTRKEILKQHSKSITELKSGRFKGCYQTFVTEEQTGKRKVIRAKTEKELKDKLIVFYTNSSKHTIEECYNGWIDYLSVNKKPSTIHSYDKVYKRHFLGIKDKYIEDFSKYDIKMFVKVEVADKELYSKAYASLKTDLLGIYHYAMDMGYVDIRIEDVVADLGRHLKGSFKRSKKSTKEDKDLIFFDDEIEIIAVFCNSSNTLVDLGILLLFGTGLRVGELAALKNIDIQDDFRAINVTRTEERISSGADYIVVDTAKTEAGDRKVLLTKDVSELLRKIAEKSDPSSEFLFSDAELDRYPAKKFRDRLYRLCKKLKLPSRSPHDIRRTYASKLYEAGVPEHLIIKQMGHIDFSVTKAFYIYNRRNYDELIAVLEQAM